jgi:hypothetical protein
MSYENGEWSSPEALSPESGGAGAFSVAMDPSGNALATWLEGNTLVAKRYSAATQAWDATPATQGIVTEFAVSSVQVGMAGNGDAIAVWVDNLRSIWAARFVGASWQSPVMLYQPSAQFLGRKAKTLAVNPNGEAITAWTDVVPVAGAPSQQQAMTAEFSNGAWTTPRVAGQNLKMWTNVSVALNGVGDAVLAWSVPISSTRQTFQVQRRKAGTWSDVAPLESTFEDDQELLWADDGQGNFWAGWTDELGPRVSLLKADGTWSSPLSLNSVGSLSALDTDLESGRPMVLWREISETTSYEGTPYQATSYHSKIFSRARLEDGSWGNPVRAGEGEALVSGVTLSKTGPDRAIAVAVYSQQVQPQARYFARVQPEARFWTNSYH